MIPTHRIQKLLVRATHPSTTENEILVAVRLVSDILAQSGRSMADIRIKHGDDEDDDGQGKIAPTITNLIRRIDSLEESVKTYARNETALQAENDRLKSRILTLQQSQQTGTRAKAPRVTPRKAPKMEATANAATSQTDTKHEMNETPEDQREILTGETTDDSVNEAATTETAQGSPTIQDMAAAVPPTRSSPEEIAARRDAKREERIQKARTAKLAKATKEPAKPRGFVWEGNPEAHRKTIDLYLSGQGKGAIAEALSGIEGGGPSISSIFSITANGRPPAFLNAKVRETGPIDWPEAWLMGSTLFAEKRSWLGPTLLALGITAPPSKGLSFDLNEHANEGAIEELRWKYRETAKKPVTE